MKINKFISTGVMAAGVLLAASAQADTTNFVFDSCLTTGGDTIGNWYGNDTPAYVAGIDDGASGDTASIYFNFTFFGGGNVSTAYECYGGGNPWYIAGAPIDFSKFTNISFEILWDTTSGLTIDQFNTGTNWQPALFGGTDEGTGFPKSGNYLNGIDLLLITDGNNTDVDLGSQLIPAAAASGWVTMNVPIPAADDSQITQANGILWKKWTGASTSLMTTNCCGKFWVDNVVFTGNAAPPPLPTISFGPTPVQGLNVWNFSEGNSYYDRNEVVVNASSGLSWAGSTATPNTTFPVSYSFNMVAFPNNANCEAYMFLVPNATALENGPDWNEATCMIFEVQSNAAGGTIQLTYKTNNPNTENQPIMVGVGFDGSNNITPVPAGSNNPTTIVSPLLGTYGLVFTGTDTGYVYGPDSVHHAFSLNAGDGAMWFAENGTAADQFLVFLGGQANAAGAINQEVAYASFTISGVPSAFSENFVSEPNFVNVTNSIAPHVASVFLMPTNAAYWIDWTSPASGYVLQNSAHATTGYQATVGQPAIAAYGAFQQLVLTSDLIAPTKTQFFDLIKRVYTQLVVWLPGQTFVNGVGVTGTPTTLHSGSTNGPWGPETAIGYALDANNYLVTSVTIDSVLLDCTTDSAASDDFIAGTAGHNYESTPMVQGQAAFTSASQTFSWGNDGLFSPATETILLQDQATGFSNYSAPVTLTSP
jgi:hypothetical protein